MSKRVSSFKSKRLRERKKKARLYKYAGVLLFLFLIIFGLSWLSRSDFAQVEYISVAGNEVVQRELVEEIVRAEISRPFLGIFSKNNFALFPRKKIEKKIYDEFSMVSNVAVSFDGLKTFEVQVTEHEPAYLWCDSVARANCYYMNKRGYIFGRSANFSQEVLFTYYGLVTATDASVNPIGQTFLPEEKLGQLNQFVESMKLLKLTPVGLNARGEGDFEMYLSTGSSVLFSDREDFLTTFENLETIIAEQEKADKNFLGRLEYIDVRFSSKAFVKMR